MASRCGWVGAEKIQCKENKSDNRPELGSGIGPETDHLI